MAQGPRIAFWRPEISGNPVKARLARAVQKAAAHLVGALKEELSKPGPTKTHPAGTSVAGEEIRASKAGEPPRKRLGILRNSVDMESANPDGTVQRVGTPLDYGFFLEFGTKRGLEPRPWLRPVFKQERGRMQDIINQELKHGGN